MVLPPTAANIETALKDNSIKYIYYQQFGLGVLNLFNKKYLIIQHKKYCSYMLYKNTPIN